MTRCQDVLLKAPYTMIISGATGAGKTQFVAKLIEQQASLHVEPFDEIIISYGVFQPVYAKLAQSKCDHCGRPT